MALFLIGSEPFKLIFMSYIPDFLSTKVRGFDPVQANNQVVADYNSQFGKSSNNSSNMWGALISAAGGIAQSLIGKGSAKQQFKWQQQLNRQQQQYAEHNALVAYQRQRQLTKDNALLQKQGMRNAGMSTAFTDGSTVGAASSVDQASPAGGGAAPSVPTVADLFGQGAQAIASVADLSMKRSQIAKTESEVANTDADTTGKVIDNSTKAEQNVANLENTKQDTKNKEVQAAIADTQKQILQATGMEAAKLTNKKLSAEAKIAEADSNVRVDQNKLDLQQRLADIDNTLANTAVSKEQKKNLIKLRDVYAKQLEVMDSQKAANYASAADSYSHVGVNNTQADLNRSVKTGQDLSNQLEALTQPDKLVESFEHCRQSQLQTLALKLQTMPKSVSEHFTREAMFALERIQKGRGTAKDYALVAAQTSREALVYANEQAKDWSSIMLRAPRASSPSSKPSTNYSVSMPSTPQY